MRHTGRVMTPFLTAEWRDLILLNFPVDRALLQPLVPAGTELDIWNGEALVSLVGFRFWNTRVLGLGIPGHRNFEEVNLRFYVRRMADDGERRAVVFVRELVPRRAIAWMARALYNEPYRAVPMRHAFTSSDGTRALRYQWSDGGNWVGLRAHTVGPPASIVPGSEAEFITEHYWGYTRQRDGGTVEYRVEHPSWRVWETRDAGVEGDLTATYGHAFAEILAGTPRSAFVADGSPITVFRPSRLASGEPSERGATR